MKDWKMDRNTLEILLKRIENLFDDLNYLQSIDPDDLLTADMREYRELMLIFMGRFFIGLHDSLDVYMSTLQAPNNEGFLKKAEEEGDKGFMRVQRNLGSSEQRRGSNVLQDDYLAEFRRLNPEYQYATAQNNSGNYSSDKWVRPKQGGESRRLDQPVNSVNEDLLTARFDGLAAGFAIASDPANNVMTEEDYFHREYEGDPNEEYVEPEDVDTDCSVTQDDIAEEIIEEFFDDVDGDISIF